MASNSIQPFRFNDLPGEIRNEIYRILLCSFESTAAPRRPLGHYAIRHSIDTTILRTSKKVYHEAYNIMVKTNRFVRVTLPDDVFLPLDTGVPVVTMDDRYVRRFKGYVLSMSLSMKARGVVSGTPQDDNVAPSEEPVNIMLLSRDLHLFCGRFDIAYLYLPEREDFGTRLMITITVAPALTEPPTPRHEYLREFFTRMVQQDLLQPFRRIRGVKAVQIRGFVSRDIATAVENDIAQDKWTDPVEVVDGITATMEHGDDILRKSANMLEKHHVRNHHFSVAWDIWNDALGLIHAIYDSPSWKGLVEKGGRSFLQKIGEFYLLIKVNWFYNHQLYKLIFEQELCCPHLGHEMLEGFYGAIRYMMEDDSWVHGFPWVLSRQQKVKMLPRLAFFTTLVRNPSLKDDLGNIYEALQLHTPDDDDDGIADSQA